MRTTSMPKFCALLLMLLATFTGCKRETSTEKDNSSNESPATPKPSTADTAEIGRADTSLIEQGNSVDLPASNGRWKTYTNEEYGFSFSYPAGLHVRDGFEKVDHLTGTWRAMAMADQPGKAVVSVPIVRYRSANAYPRYYDVDLRIGVSSELGNSCAAKNGERTLGTIVVNGATFNQFEFSDAAMMQYVSGISYRTGHNGKCFAIEQIRSGSNYRDESSSRDLSQSMLDSCYYLAGKIMKTFRFTK